MAKYLVTRDFGFGLAGKFFGHGEVFEDTNLLPDLLPGANAEEKASQLSAKAAVEQVVQESVMAGHLEPLEAWKAAALPAEKEG